MQYVYKKSEEYNSGKKLIVLIVFGNVIADMTDNKKVNSVVNSEVFLRGRILDVSIVFITQSYFKVPKEVSLNTKHFSLWKFQIKESFNKLH